MVKNMERDQTGKFTGKREFINREDYEYTLKNTFINATLLISAISIYVAVAYVFTKQLQK